MFQRCNKKVVGTVGSVFFLLALFIPHSVFALVNINTSSQAELETLTGIGPSKSLAIIDYRNINGPFATIDEIKNVSGIGDVTFENIKNDITVSGETEVVEEDEETQEASEPPPVTGGGVFIEDLGFITVNGGEDRTVFVGADSVFTADARGLKGEPLNNAQIRWSFGNGDRKEGQSVLYHFQYPGTYVVSIDVASSKYTATDRIIVKAVPAAVAVSQVTGEFIGIANELDQELDIGGWLLTANGRQFAFPRPTIILPQEEVLVSNQRTGLHPISPESVALMYPNGIVAATHEYPLIIGRTTIQKPKATISAPKPTVAGVSTQKEGSEPSSNQATSPILAVTGDPKTAGLPPMLMWFSALLGLVGVGSAGVMMVKRRNTTEGFLVEEVK